MLEAKTETMPPETMIDAQGKTWPTSVVSDADKLENETVNDIVKYAVELSDQIARFKGHTFDDVNTVVELLGEKYGVHKGGRKGNLTLTSFDGCRKVQVQVADHIDFGPQLQIAKGLVDECIEEWRDGTRDEMMALVNNAFEVGKEGLVNKNALFKLRRVKIENPKWKQAMQAITDSIRVIGSKSYVRIYQRDNAEAAWKMIQLNIAAVE